MRWLLLWLFAIVRLAVQSTGFSADCQKADGVYRNKADCSSYYTCHGGRISLHDCPPGLLFSEKSKKCEYGEQVDWDCEEESNVRRRSTIRVERMVPKGRRAGAQVPLIRIKRVRRSKSSRRGKRTKLKESWN